MVRDRLSEEMVYELGPKVKGSSHERWDKNILGRENSGCKNPEMKKGSKCSRKQKKTTWLTIALMFIEAVD